MSLGLVTSGPEGPKPGDLYFSGLKSPKPGSPCSGGPRGATFVISASCDLVCQWQSLTRVQNRRYDIIKDMTFKTWNKLNLLYCDNGS